MGCPPRPALRRPRPPKGLAPGVWWWRTDGGLGPKRVLVMAGYGEFRHRRQMVAGVHGLRLRRVRPNSSTMAVYSNPSREWGRAGPPRAPEQARRSWRAIRICRRCYDRPLALGMCGNHQVAVGSPAGSVSDPSQAGEASAEPNGDHCHRGGSSAPDRTRPPLAKGRQRVDAGRRSQPHRTRPRSAA